MTEKDTPPVWSFRPTERVRHTLEYVFRTEGVGKSAAINWTLEKGLAAWSKLDHARKKWANEIEADLGADAVLLVKIQIDPETSEPVATVTADGQNVSDRIVPGMSPPLLIKPDKEFWVGIFHPDASSQDIPGLLVATLTLEDLPTARALAIPEIYTLPIVNGPGREETE